jgi:hypothetical protein
VEQITIDELYGLLNTVSATARAHVLTCMDDTGVGEDPASSIAREAGTLVITNPFLDDTRSAADTIGCSPCSWKKVGILGYFPQICTALSFNACQ